MDDLCWPPIDRRNGGAEDFMTPDYLIEASLQHGHIERTA
jgi:hypothetical protein